MGGIWACLGPRLSRRQLLHPCGFAVPPKHGCSHRGSPWGSCLIVTRNCSRKHFCVGQGGSRSPRWAASGRSPGTWLQQGWVQHAPAALALLLAQPLSHHHFPLLCDNRVSQARQPAGVTPGCAQLVPGTQMSLGQCPAVPGAQVSPQAVPSCSRYPGVPQAVPSCAQCRCWSPARQQD